MNDEIAFKKNLDKNKQKVGFFRFLIYSTKIEIHIEEFQCLLFWVSLLEIVLFIFAFLLFISDTDKFALFWTFITHVIRAIIGFMVLKRFPDTHNLIEDIGDCENSTIEEIESAIVQKYKNILSNNEHRLKPVLIAYFVFTIIDIIVDNVIFFFLLDRWKDSVYMYQNYMSLILIVTFFSNIY
jgi:hypothetical protein